jgi:hypothetical protein
MELLCILIKYKTIVAKSENDKHVEKCLFDVSTIDYDDLMMNITFKMFTVIGLTFVFNFLYYLFERKI